MDLLFASARNKIQTQIILGSGSNGEITGLVNDSAVTNTAGTSVDQAKVAGTMEAVEKQAGDGALAWVVTAPAATILRQRAEVSGGQAILRDGKIGGYPVYIVGGTTAAHAAFGRWSDLLLYSWAPVEIAVNPFAVFQAGIIGVRAWATVAAAPLVNGSFAVLDTIT